MKFDSEHSDIDYGIIKSDAQKQKKSEYSEDSNIDSDTNCDSSLDLANKNETISKRLGLSLSKRAELGFKAKAILDWGRISYLRKQGFDANLHFYVDKDVSLENVCIVATKI